MEKREWFGGEWFLGFEVVFDGRRTEEQGRKRLHEECGQYQNGKEREDKVMKP